MRSSPATTVRNTQPFAHPPLRLLPLEHGGGDVLDRLGHGGPARRRAIDSISRPVPTAAGYALLLDALR